MPTIRRLVGFTIIPVILIPMILSLRSCFGRDSSMVWEFDGHKSSIRDVAILPNGKWAVSIGGYDLRVWDLKSGKCLKVISPGWSHMAMSPDGGLVAVSHDVIRVFRTNDWSDISTFEKHNCIVGAIAFSPDGKRIISSSGLKDGSPGDNLVRVWEAETGRELKVFRGHLGPVYAVSFTPDGKRCLSASSDCTIREWDFESGRETHRHGEEKRGVGLLNRPLSIAPDGKRAICGSVLIDIESWKTLPWVDNMPSDGETINYGVFSPNGKRVLTGANDGKIRLHEFPSGKVIWSAFSNLNHTKVTALAFSGDGRLAISGGFGHRGWDLKGPGPNDDEIVRVWRLPD